MKYSESNAPLVCMMTQSTCYRGTKKMNVRGVLWHSTGADNPTLKRYVQPDDDAPDRERLLALLGKNRYNNDWNHKERQAGMNAWIGQLADGKVASVQVMPWDYKPWGCGSGKKGSCNNGWIQFEICEDDMTDPEYFARVYDEACELTAYLCRMYGIDPKGTVSYNGVTAPTVLCHKDSYRLGLGSNHSDVYEWFDRYGKSMETARDDVAKLLGAEAPSVPDVAESKRVNVAVEVVKRGVKSDAVRAVQALLNMRANAGLDVDGSCGAATEAAIKAYQKANGLEVDGSCGAATWGKMLG